jgi:parallel beta-helix repeat protein
VIHPHIFSKSYIVNYHDRKRVAKDDKSYFFLNEIILSVFRFLVLCFTSGMGVAYMAMLGVSLDVAIAQIPRTADGKQLDVKTMSQVNVLFVNPSVGDDKVNNGSEGTPFKTISQALRIASPNTVIILSSGTYSAETGENFPLILKPNISIQGDSRSKGRGIVIKGGDTYLSRTFGGKNVTIVGANQAKLSGVTVTNPNSRGYGLWIEYSNPVIVENTFTGSTQDGIAVTGNSTPNIRNNFFYQNGANGITVSGNSQAEVRENVFQQTGFGVNITENAQPIVVSNSIQDNRSGIVVQANARPILRNNLIQGSKEDGLVAISQAIPNLGTASEPGGNQFRNNARYDINASAAKEIFPAFGNSVANNRINGNVDFTGTTAVANAGIARTRVRENSPANPSASPRLPLPTYSNNASRGLNNQLQPLVPVNSPLSATATNQKQPYPQNPGLPTPNSLTRYGGQSPTRTLPPRQVAPTRAIQPLANTSSISRQANSVRVSPGSVEFSAPETASNTVDAGIQGTLNRERLTGNRERLTGNREQESQDGVNLPQMTVRAPLPASGRQVPQLNATFSNQVTPAPVQRVQSQGQSALPTLEAAPVGEAALLPVPNSNIPLGNTSNMRKVPVPQKSSTTAYVGNSSPSPAQDSQTNLRYRVVVEVQNEKEQELVKFLAPNAFRTVWRGKGVMQVGVFNTRNNADSIIKILNNNGFKAVIEPVN